MEKAANKELAEYSGENPCFGFKFSKKDVICFKEKQIKQWDVIEVRIGEGLNQIFGKAEAKTDRKEWYQTLGVICSAYKKSMGPPLLSEQDYFLKEKVCIICKQDTHHILFDPVTIYKFHKQSGPVEQGLRGQDLLIFETVTIGKFRLVPNRKM